MILNITLSISIIRSVLPACPYHDYIISLLRCNAPGNGHVDAIKWKHFPRYWPFVWGIDRSPVNSPHRGQWRFDVFFDLRPNKRLSKQSWGWGFEIPSRSLWRHYNEYWITVISVVVCSCMLFLCCGYLLVRACIRNGYFLIRVSNFAMLFYLSNSISNVAFVLFIHVIIIMYIKFCHKFKPC